MGIYYQLLRVRSVRKPRVDWPDRWAAAGAAVKWKGVVFLRDKIGNVTDDMIAEKSSPIWKALAKGAGGFRDAIGKGKPPFAFGSGLGWSVKRLDERKSRGVQDIKSVEKTTIDTVVHDKVLDAVAKLSKALPKVIKLEMKI